MRNRRANKPRSRASRIVHRVKEHANFAAQPIGIRRNEVDSLHHSMTRDEFNKLYI